VSGKDKFRDAVNAFGQATGTDPGFLNTLFNKSLARGNPGKDTGVLHAFDKAITLNPKDKEAQSQRVLILRKKAQVSIMGRTDSQSVQYQLRV
jgi:hypothetical protein